MPTLSLNKKAKFDYTVLETYTAGLELSGQETKSARFGGANLTGSYVTFHNNEAYAINIHIAPYKFSGPLTNYDPTRSRRLLLKKKEILYLQQKIHEAGLTIVVLSLYTKGRLIKTELGLVKGKKKWDKRAAIKKREIDREIRSKLGG